MKVHIAKTAIVYSRYDLAGLNIKDRILELEEFRTLKEDLYYSNDLNAYLAGFPEEIINIDYVDRMFQVKDYVFISKHSSVKKVKSITAHFTGNVTWEASHGARARELAYTNPQLLKKVYTRLVRHSLEEGLTGEYDVTLEATHHGPTNLSKPLLFVEIGSDEESWRDKKPARVIAESILEALREEEPKCVEVALGVGGGHYARKHSRVELSRKTCYSHIFAKYTLEFLDLEVLREATRKTLGNCSLVLVEKKSVPSAIRRSIVENVESLKLKVEYI